MKRPEKTREDDERELRMLRMRDRGISASRIGQTLGMTRSAVLGQLARIEADLAKSEAA